MKTLEEHITRLADAGKFWDDCRTVFSGADGIRLMESLVGFRHPFLSAMDSRTEADPCITAFIEGQKDIISTLCRFSMEKGGAPAFNPHSMKK